MPRTRDVHSCCLVRRTPSVSGATWICQHCGHAPRLLPGAYVGRGCAHEHAGRRDMPSKSGCHRRGWCRGAVMRGESRPTVSRKTPGKEIFSGVSPESKQGRVDGVVGKPSLLPADSPVRVPRRGGSVSWPVRAYASMPAGSTRASHAGDHSPSASSRIGAPSRCRHLQA